MQLGGREQRTGTADTDHRMRWCQWCDIHDLDEHPSHKTAHGITFDLDQGGFSRWKTFEGREREESRSRAALSLMAKSGPEDGGGGVAQRAGP